MSSVNELVFKVLGNRQRTREQTDLTGLFRTLKKLDKTITEQSFLLTFRELESKGIGSLVIGRKGNPNRFVWKYNLKEVAAKALAKQGYKDLKPLHESKTKGFVVVQPDKLKEVLKASPAGISFSFTLKDDANPKEVVALLELAKSLTLDKH